MPKCWPLASSVPPSGNPLNVPVTVCPAGCQLGVLPFLVVISGVPSVTIPVPRDRALIGGQLAVQAMIVGVPFGCGAPQFPVSFVMTDTITMTFG